MFHFQIDAYKFEGYNFLYGALAGIGASGLALSLLYCLCFKRSNSNGFNMEMEYLDNS